MNYLEKSPFVALWKLINRFIKWTDISNLFNPSLLLIILFLQKNIDKSRSLFFEQDEWSVISIKYIPAKV